VRGKEIKDPNASVFRHLYIAYIVIVGRTCTHIREDYNYYCCYYCYYLGLMFILSMVCRSYLTWNIDIFETFDGLQTTFLSRFISIFFIYAHTNSRFVFLGAFTKLRNASIISPWYLSVRPHGNLGSYSTGFNEIWYLNIFRKSVEKIHVSLKFDDNISLSSS
jgi:hypothetical protein